MPKATYHETLTSIEAAKTPVVVNPNLRCEPRKEWAKEVRALFKKLGVVGVSVTTPNHSMARSIYLSITASGAHEHDTGVEWENCLVCKRRANAKAKLEALVLAAFPDLDDRSDTMTDYFDYCLMVTG